MKATNVALWQVFLVAGIYLIGNDQAPTGWLCIALAISNFLVIPLQRKSNN